MDGFYTILNTAWEEYCSRIAFLLNTNQTWSQIIAIIIIILLINFIIILPIHKAILRKITQSKFNLTSSVDEIIYKLSKAQYNILESQNLKYDPCFALMKSMFNSGEFEYLNNLPIIKDNVKKVEGLLHQSIISEQEWETIDRQSSKLKTQIFWSKFVGYELNIVTLGIYNLFW